MTTVNMFIILVIAALVVIVLWYLITVVRKTKSSLETMKDQLTQINTLANDLLLENHKIKDNIESLVSADLQKFMNDLESKGLLDERLAPLLEILKQGNLDRH